MKTPEGIVDQVAWELITKARTQLLLSNPFFGSLHMKVPFVEDPTCQTMWIDGVKQGYNPEWIKSHETLENKCGLAHEACHVLLLHHLRRGNKDPLEWNIATDYAVNGILVKAGFHLPEGWLYDPMYNGKSAEEIYGMRNPPKPEQPPEPSKPSKNDEEGDTGDEESEGQPGDEEGDDKSEPGDEEGEGESGEDGEGEGDEEGEGSGKPGQGDPGQAGEVRDMPSPSGQEEPTKAEIDQAEADMKVAVAQAENQHEKIAGELPGAMKRFIRDYIEPKIPWQEILWRFFQTSAKNDYSWEKPNRKYVSKDLYLPSMISTELKDVVMFVDTSGSQSESDVKQCGSEITAILESFPAHLWVLGIDRNVASVEEFTSEDLPVTLHLAGGGGTDFRPGFKWVEENNIYPTCVIYLTDGECSSYPEEPPYPVLWIGTRQKFDPPFGELVMMHP